MAIDSELNFTKTKWACRRGMLELDLILQPFIEDNYDELSISAKKNINEFLTNTDQDLFSWLVLGKTPEDRRWEDLILVIRYYASERAFNS